MLLGYWKDPNFNPKERAFYYVRVIEIPTPRWTTYDAKILRHEAAGKLPDVDPGPRLHLADLVHPRRTDVEDQIGLSRRYFTE